MPSGGNDIFDLHAVSAREAWVSSEGPGIPGDDIYVRRFKSGLWEDAGRLSGGSDSDMTPSIVLDYSGIPWVAWWYLGDGTPFVARRVNDQWVTEALPAVGFNPVLAATPTSVFLVWSVDDGNFGSNLSYRVWSNNHWEQSGFVNEPDAFGTLESTPSLAASAGHPPVVVWSSESQVMPNAMDIVFSQWSGSGWSPEEQVSVPDSVELAKDEYPDVALGPDGKAWAVWRRRESDQDMWYAIREESSAGIDAAGGPLGSAPAIWTAPNPAHNSCAASFRIVTEGDYEIIIADVAGRIVDVVPLGTLDSGIYRGAQAFHWPVVGQKEVGSGIYFLKLRNHASPLPIAESKIVLLR